MPGKGIRKKGRGRRPRDPPKDPSKGPPKQPSKSGTTRSSKRYRPLTPQGQPSTGEMAGEQNGMQMDDESDQNAGGQEAGSQKTESRESITPIPGPSTMTGSAQKRVKRFSDSGTAVDDRLWEKQQLQNINYRIDNIFKNIPSIQKAQSPGLAQSLEDVQRIYDERINKLSDDFNARVTARDLACQRKEEQIRQLNKENTELQNNRDDAITLKERAVAKADQMEKERDAALRGKERAEGALQREKETLEHKLNVTNDELVGLRRANSRLKSDLDRLKKEKEREFMERLGDQLNERDIAHAKEKETQSELFEKEIESLRKSYGIQIEELQKTLGDQRDELKLNQTELLEKDREIAKMNESILGIKRNLSASKLNSQAQRENLLKTIEQLKKSNREHLEAFQRQELDLNFVNQTNLSLKKEIKSLEKKLDDFEQKHRIDSPFKPRLGKRTRRGNSAVRSSSMTTDDDEQKSPDGNRKSSEGSIPSSTMSNVIELRAVQGKIIDRYNKFPLAVKTRQYDGDWRGFELTNDWGRPIRLVGWSLKDKHGKHALALPQRVIHPMGILRVCLTRNKKEDTDLVWPDLQIRASDKPQLFVHDSLNNRHKLATIDHQGIPTSAVDDEQSCFVM